MIKLDSSPSLPYRVCDGPCNQQHLSQSDDQTIEIAATSAILHCQLSREDSLQNVCSIFEHLWTRSDLLHCNCSSNHRRFARPVTGIHEFVRFRCFVLSNLETMLRYCRKMEKKQYFPVMLQLWLHFKAEFPSTHTALQLPP